MQAAINAGICILDNPAEGSVSRGQAELVTFSNVCGSLIIIIINKVRSTEL